MQYGARGAPDTGVVRQTLDAVREKGGRHGVARPGGRGAPVDGEGDGLAFDIMQPTEHGASEH